MRRKRVSRRRSRKQFKRTAMKVNRKNGIGPSRGGYRL